MKTLVYALLIACALGYMNTALAAQPNVILIMTDDQGYGDFGATGNPLIRTPNIDAMAERSAMMTTFYVSPVCSPTRACLMTGRYNYRTRVIDTWIGRSMMDPEEVTLPEVLNSAGYATGIFGKWHLGDSYPMRAIDQGFDEALIHRGGGLAQPADHPDNDNRYTNAILYKNGEPVPTEGFCTDVYFDAALDFITRQSDEAKPFFTYIAMNAPHGPYHDVPEKLRNEYVNESMEDIITPAMDERRLGGEVDKLERIASMITNVDENVGRLFAFLEEKNLIENTFVMFLTDNGPNTARYVGPFRGQKSDVYEGGIRTPLWMHWPAKFPAGTKRDTLTAHIDLMPTILDICEVKAPQDVSLDGRSFLPLLLNQNAAWPERTITIQTHRGTQPQRFHHFMTRDNRWKLVHPSGFGRESFDGKPEFELYDLQNDPGETNNLASTEKEILARLKTQYEAWFDDVSTTRPDNYAPPLIQVGTIHEPITSLTRQDWIAEAWGPQANGFWNIDVREAGKYDIRLHLYKSTSPERAALHVGDKVYTTDIADNAQYTDFMNIEITRDHLKVYADIHERDSKTSPYQIEIRKSGSD